MGQSISSNSQFGLNKIMILKVFTGFGHFRFFLNDKSRFGKFILFSLINNKDFSIMRCLFIGKISRMINLMKNLECLLLYWLFLTLQIILIVWYYWVYKAMLIHRIFCTVWCVSHAWWMGIWIAKHW